MRRFATWLLLPLVAASMTGCLPMFGCTLKRGLGPTTPGEIAAGTHTSHTLDLVPGAQNDVYVMPRDSSQKDITYRIYVTSTACDSFSPDAKKWELRWPVIQQDPCAVISSDTLTPRPVLLGRVRFTAAAYVIVRAHEVDGAHRFKLWIIGDPRVPVAYDVRLHWSSGHDC